MNSRRFSSWISPFVPKHSPVRQTDILQLQHFLDGASKLLVITGAGISTESGLPDYRSEGVGLYNSTYRPINYQDYLSSETTRRTYWARNFFGWPRFSSVKPNVAHNCLAEWEKSGRLISTVTQNVDKLHTKAGNKRVVELHGSAFRVICLTCSNVIPRSEFQEILIKSNPDSNLTSTSVEIKTDGDVSIPEAEMEKFIIPPCEKCGGILKPDIVFFGDNVPKERVNLVYSQLNESDKLLIIGSSLTVFSVYRFLLACKEQSKPVSIINIGPTRADHLAEIKITARCGDLIPKLKFS